MEVRIVLGPGPPTGESGHPLDARGGVSARRRAVRELRPPPSVRELGRAEEAARRLYLRRARRTVDLLLPYGASARPRLVRPEHRLVRHDRHDRTTRVQPHRHRLLQTASARGDVRRGRRDAPRRVEARRLGGVSRARLCRAGARHERAEYGPLARRRVGSRRAHRAAQDRYGDRQQQHGVLEHLPAQPDCRQKPRDRNRRSRDRV